MCIFLGDGRALEDSQGLKHSRKVKKEEYANVTSKQGRQRRTRSRLCPRSQGECLSLTSVASLHVWAQPHCVRTGTCVLGGVAGDLRSRKAQVFTPTIGLGTQFTGICSWWQGRGRQTKCWDTDRLCQVLLSSNNEIPPLNLLKNLSLLLYGHPLAQYLVLYSYSHSVLTVLTDEPMLRGQMYKLQLKEFVR